MEINITCTTPVTTMDPSCSASASESDTSSGDGEPRPAGVGKKEKTTKPEVVCLEKLLQEAPPEYLTLSLPYCSARAATEPYQRPKRPGEVSLANVDAPRDFLSLALKPSDQPKRCSGPDVSGGGGSVVGDASSVASSAAAEGALMVVEDMIPPPAQVPATYLPPKKRKLAAAGAYQETGGTAPASSSQCLALAIVNGHNDVYRSSMPPGADADSETRSPATVAHPIDAVPLQAVCIRGGVPHHFRLSGGAGTTITANDAASTSSSTAAPPEPAWIRETLGLAAEHNLIFISSKRVQRSDIDKQRSRFMVIPRGETNDRLLPLLNPDERRAAGLHEAWERPKREHGGDGERPRVQGKVHGGLVVKVTVNRAGNWMDAKLTRWDSTGSTVLKFRNAESSVSESVLRKDDDIQIWAVRRYGVLHLVIAKIDGETAAAAAGGQQV